MSKKRNKWLFVLLLLAGLITAIFVKFYIQKEKASEVLEDQIPKAPFKAQIDMKKALALAYSLKGDTLFQMESERKWKSLLGDVKNGGIDLLVNPWFFGDRTSLNIAFQLSSISDFKKWAQETSDSAFVYKGQVLYFIPKINLVVSHNGGEIALASFCNLEKAKYWSGMFFNSKQTKSRNPNQFASNSLIDIKLNPPFSILKFLEISDSSLSVNVDDRNIRVNSPLPKESEIPLSFALQMDSAKWKYLKSKLQLKEVFELLGLGDVNLHHTKPMFGMHFKDTFHKVTKSVSYVFDDDFNKVKTEKIFRKPLADLSVSFSFKDDDELNLFVKQNKLAQFKHPFLVFQKFNRQVVLSAQKAKQEEIPEIHVDFNSQAFWKVSKYLGLKKTEKMAFLSEVELIQFRERNKESQLLIRFAEHPILWALKTSRELRKG